MIHGLLEVMTKFWYMVSFHGLPYLGLRTD
jgi:hypothetical protein